MTDRLFFNVLERPLIAGLEELNADDTAKDLLLIRSFLRADSTASEDLRARGRRCPEIAREVLDAIWGAPRSRFHRKHIRGRMDDPKAFGSKLTMIPWSMEAFDHAKSGGNMRELTLEHVTPVKVLWSDLKEIDALSTSDADWMESEDDLWVGWSTAYLHNNYLVAVLTQQQARAVDSAGYRDTSIGDTSFLPGRQNPFLRYDLARKDMDAGRVRDRHGNLINVPLDVSKFVIPGLPPD